MQPVGISHHLNFAQSSLYIIQHHPHTLKMVTSRGNSSSRSTRTGNYNSHRQITTSSRPLTGHSRPLTTATTPGIGENEIICSISESRGISPTIGLSFVNLYTSQAVLCQFADTQTYARACHKIKVFGPSEIIFMKTAADSKLFVNNSRKCSGW